MWTRVPLFVTALVMRRSSVQCSGCSQSPCLLAISDPLILAASPISTFEKGCGFISGLFPLRLAYLEKLFSDGVLWHVAELMEDSKNGRTTNVTVL